MTGEFRTAKGWRIVVYIFSPLLIALFIYVGFIALASGASNLAVSFILIPVSLAGTIMIAYGLLETIKGRFVIGTNSISTVSILGTRTLEFEEIKGFRSDLHYIYVVSKILGKKSIRITSATERFAQIQEWFSTHFIELDSHEAEKEEQSILLDDEFGINTQARQCRLNEARKVAMYINIFGGIAGVWAWFYPRPYILSLSAGMIIPAIALASLYVYRGLIRFDEKKNSAHPSIIYGFLFPGVGLMIRAVMDYEIFQYKGLWIAVSIATVSLTFLVVVATKELKFEKVIDYFTTLSLAGMILCYSFGTYVVLNCLFDKTEPEVFKSEVTDKEISTGKTTIYYLYLKPWGPRTEVERVSVAKDNYEATDKGAAVDVFLKGGLLGTPWFYVVTE